MADGALLMRKETGGALAGASLDAAAAAPHVTVRGLTKRFGKASIYERFDLDIPRGKLVSVFGPNGCGKSTLINIIAGLIPPDAGGVFAVQELNLAGRAAEVVALGKKATAKLGKLVASWDDGRDGGVWAASAARTS